MADEKLLSAKMERFCQEMMLHDSPEEAAMSAGYSPDNRKSAAATASRLLKRADVRARITELRKERSDALGIDKDWVILKLVDVVNRSMQAVEVEKWDYSEKQLVGTGEYVFDSKGANTALQLIGKHLGIFDDKLQLGGTVNVNDARSRLAEKLAGRSKPRGNP